LAHHEALSEAGMHEELWRLNPTPVRTSEEMRAYIEEALLARSRGTALPFATIEKSSGHAIGSTRYGNIEMEHRRLEIGWTWITPRWQRTAVNTEAKYLMLRHAFEQLNCMRVEFKTDVLNERSRNAILRLGAKEEGIFRNHMITSTGRIRDSIYFSIIDTEWPEVKAGLERKLESYPPG
jgi:RimJ/RimL family protein N-acetyltransferase